MLDKKNLQNQSISKRAFLIGAGKLALLSLLGMRMFYLQLLKNNEYKTLSDKNRINFLLMQPFRGQIYDIAGTVIATNQACFRLFLDRKIGENYQQELQLINKILELSEEKIKYINKRIKITSRRQPVMILDQLDWRQISLIEEQKINLNSIFIEMGYSRFYPMADPLCHIIGYMGQINEQEKQELNISNLNDFNIGKAGIEKYYEEKLRGEFGYKQVEVNAFGKQIREITNVAAEKGNDLYLNIDAKLQEKIQPYLNKQGCSAIVMDSTNGNILIMSASPAFEPNNFTKLSQNYWQSLINNPYKPLINKAVQNNYPPGSVFKIITILAALEAGITVDKTVHCTGESVLGSNSFRCWHKHGHGIVDMFSAIKYSCNTYMYELGRIIGCEKIMQMAERFGFGAKTGVDILGEASGFVPSKEWKQNKLKSKWSIGDTLNLSIGQGFLLATPIQLARFAAAIASNGRLYTPRIARNEPNYSQINIDQKYLNILKEGMFKAVNTAGGTAYYSRILAEKHQLAGKTGTAQVQSKVDANDDLSRESIAWEKRNHAVFLGFAPYKNPLYSIAVFVDHGGGGGRAAAPIASKIMAELLHEYV